MRAGKISRAVIVGLLAAGAVLAAAVAAHAEYRWSIGPAGAVSVEDDQQTNTDPNDEYRWSIGPAGTSVDDGQTFTTTTDPSTDPDDEYRWSIDPTN